MKKINFKMKTLLLLLAAFLSVNIANSNEGDGDKEAQAERLKDHHLGFNLGPIMAPEKEQEEDSVFSFFGSSLSLGTFSGGGYGSGVSNWFTDWKSTIFDDDDLLSFDKSTCSKTCDKKAWNCGWGPVTDDYLRRELKKCDFDYDFKLITTSPALGLDSVQCESGSVDDVEKSLESIKDLINYDCANLRPQGEGKFCECILTKSGDVKDHFYSPLTPQEVDSLNAMVELDTYQKEVAALEDSFSTVSSILSEAFLINDPEINELLKQQPHGQACTPGGFNQLEAFLKTPRKDLGGDSLCGDRGIATLDNVYKLNVKIRECGDDGCESDPDANDPRKEAQRSSRSNRRKGNAALRHFDKMVASLPGGGRFFGAVNHATAQDMQERANLSMEQVDALQTQTMQQITQACVSAAGVVAEGIDIAIDGVNDGLGAGVISPEVCPKEPAMNPPIEAKYVRDIAHLLKKYRNGSYKDINEFAEEIGDASYIKELKDSIHEDYNIIDLGVLKNHAYADSPIGKLVEMLDAIVEPGKDILSAGSEMKLANSVRSGLKSIQKGLVASAMEKCDQFIAQTVNMCRKLGPPDNQERPELSPKEYNDFGAETASRFANYPEYLGSVNGISKDGLARKFNQLRCSKIVDDPKLAEKAFSSDKEGIIGPQVENAMDIVTASELPANQVKELPKEVIVNPFKGPASLMADIYEQSDSEGLREMARGIRASKDMAFKRSVAEAQETLGGGTASSNSAIFTDTDTTVQSISDMTKNTLGPATNQMSAASAAQSQFANTALANTVKELNRKQSLEEEKRQVERDQKEADDRLDVIASRLADLMESREKNKNDIKEKAEELTPEEQESDPDYQAMLIEKLKLEREIANLNREKLEKSSEKKQFEKRLAEIESAKSSEEGASTGAAGTISTDVAVAKAKAAKSGGGTKSGGKAGRSIASAGGGVSSAGGGGGSGGSSISGDSFFESAPYVITLTQDQVSAIKQNFQLLEKTDRWVAGGKPPVIREGNIFYELEVKDGKIVVDSQGKPVKKKALNGFNVADLRSPASEKPGEKVKGTDQSDIETSRARRRAAVIKLNAILDGK